MHATDPAPVKPEATADSLSDLPPALRHLVAILKGLPLDVTAAWTVVGAMIAAASAISQFAPPEHQDLTQAIVLGILLIAVLALAFIIWRLRPTSTTPVSTPAAALLRGLVPFDESDFDGHNRLPGRNADVESLYARISSRVSTLTIVRGPAGCGKTSLVSAGLIPRLIEKGYRPLYVSLTERDPDKVVEEKLHAIARSDEDRTALRNAPDIVAKLAAAGRARPAESRELVLICDQAEVAVLPVSAKLQPQRLDALGRYLRAATRNVHLVLVIRDTAWGSLVRALTQSAPDALQLLTGTSPIDVLPLTKNEARAVLLASVQRGDIAFEPALIAALLRDLDQPGGVSPALLQITATLLRDHDVERSAEYAVLRGRNGLLSLHVANAIANAVDPATALQILSQAVTSTGAEPADASPQADTDPQAAQLRCDVAAQLMHAGILSVTQQGTYELTYPLFQAPVRAAIAEARDETGEIAGSVARLTRYIAERDDGHIEVIPERDLQDILQKAPVRSLIQASARRLLTASQQAAMSRRRRLRLATATTGTLAAGGLLFASTLFMVRTSYRPVDTFETVDGSSRVRATVSSLAIIPARALAIMSLKGETYGLYMYRYGDADGAIDAIRSDEQTGQALQIAGSENTSFSALAMAPSGDFIVTGGSDGTIRLWDVSQLRPMSPAEPDEVSTRGDGEQPEDILGTRLLRGSLRDERASKQCNDTRVVDADFSASGELILTGTACGLVELWERDQERGSPPVASGNAGGKLARGDIALSGSGTLVGVRSRNVSDELTPVESLKILRRNGGQFDEVASDASLGNELEIVAMEFDKKERLTVVGYTDQEIRVLRYDAAGQWVPIHVEPGVQVKTPRLAVMTRGTATVGFKARDWNPEMDEATDEPVAWRVVDLDRPIRDEQRLDHLAGAALSTDGEQLVLWGSTSVGIYRRSSFVGPIHVGWFE